MKNAKATPWIVGAVFAGLVLAALAWLVAISPQLDATAVAKADTDAALAQNVVQQQRLVTLKKQFADLDSYKADLAALRVQIPTDRDLAGLYRQIDAAALAANVTVLRIEVEPASALVAVAPAAAAPVAPAADGTATAPADPAAAATPSAEAAGVPGFYAIPLHVTVLGTYQATSAFLVSMQTGLARLVMTTDMSIKGQAEAEAAAGRPATKEGDAEVTIGGLVYVLTEASTAAGTATDSGTTN